MPVIPASTPDLRQEDFHKPQASWSYKTCWEEHFQDPTVTIQDDLGRLHVPAQCNDYDAVSQTEAWPDTRVSAMLGKWDFHPTLAECRESLIGGIKAESSFLAKYTKENF